ncbi:MAG: hypothetical protein EHM42_02595, partial [Planctomycetaceae bacterium]
MTADPPDADWPVDEIELAYQRALNALDASSEDIAAAVVEEPVAAPGAAHDLPVPAEHAPEPAATGVIETPLASNDAALVAQTPVAPGPPRPV